MLWKVGVYSCLSERLIRDGRDSAKRVVSDTDTPKVLLKKRGTKRTVPFVPLYSLSFLFFFSFYLLNVLRGANAVVLLEGSREVRL